jgi:hypothetical protein
MPILPQRSGSLSHAGNKQPIQNNRKFISCVLLVHMQKVIDQFNIALFVILSIDPKVSQNEPDFCLPLATETTPSLLVTRTIAFSRV